MQVVFFDIPLEDGLYEVNLQEVSALCRSFLDLRCDFKIRHHWVKDTAVSVYIEVSYKNDRELNEILDVCEQRFARKRN